QDGVPEVDRAPLTVGEPTVVEDLQQDVEDGRVGLLHLVEQDDGVWATADRLGELAAFVVADVAGRSADETGDRVLLTVFAHIDPDQSLLIVEEEVRERFRQLRLAHTGGTEEQERTRGTIRIGDTGPRAADGIGDRGDGGLLSDQPLTEDALRPEQLLDLALHEPAGGDARPRRDHLGDVIAGDLVRDHRIRGLTGLGLSLFGFGLGDLLLYGRDLAVEQ